MYALHLHRGVRSIHTTLNSPRLSKFSLHPPKTVEVGYSDGSVFNFSAEYLRIHSPAGSPLLRVGTSTKDIVIFGRRHVGIMSAEPIGNYGVRLIFVDLQKTGIYTWDYFYYLGSSKFTLIRNYIKTLKKHGLTRDPPRRK